jgi:hypothetical protein
VRVFLFGDSKMSKQLREHQARKTALVKEARALTDLVASQDRDMTDDEVTTFEALRTRIDSASNAIDREAALIADESRIGLATLAGPSVTDNRQADPLHGFRTMGEFVQAVFQAEKPGKNIDERLLIGGGRNAAAPGTFSNEAAGQGNRFVDLTKSLIFSQLLFI